MYRQRCSQRHSVVVVKVRCCRLDHPKRSLDAHGVSPPIAGGCSLCSPIPQRCGREQRLIANDVNRPYSVADGEGLARCVSWTSFLRRWGGPTSAGGSGLAAGGGAISGG